MSLKKSIPRSQVVRIIDEDDELKNVAGQFLKQNQKFVLIYDLQILCSALKGK